MQDHNGINRRTFVQATATTAAALAVTDLFGLGKALAENGPAEGIGYFARFGVTETLTGSFRRSPASEPISSGQATPAV